ncbi:MAG: UDP-N-acetylglucosamine--N-acetylmuramyl-(pentapeptide) pyrophosphoryl-undecaprenol N-acetylglucosamine transferase, partial [Campylobacter sp.]|nr:UDP-N-acetylglucosamine--N-acetylmuramyl-(pentapeptide) pyrophosphoryl-undecaprenol N-acetylglucosamine transferase [Campylobacter sp.]
SGASTLWELCANQLPAIFIPFPHAANDHQYFNAKFLADENLAKIYRQEKATKSLILREILDYDVANVSKNLNGVLKKDAVKKIVDDIVKNIKCSAK